MTDKPSVKGSSLADIYDLQPLAFAKQIGLTPPKNPTGAMSYDGLLQLAADRYYDLNPHLARPLRRAS